MTARAAKIAARVERLHDRRRPMRVIFSTCYPGEPEPEPPPSVPGQFTVHFVTRYLSQEESEAEIQRDREHGRHKPDCR
jgi:hypothetical protein